MGTPSSKKVTTSFQVYRKEDTLDPYVGTYIDEYYLDLYNEVRNWDERGPRYNYLLEELYKLPFTVDTDNGGLLEDQNRVIDAHSARLARGCESEHYCTILELIIMVARRIEGYLWDYSIGNRTANWFWMMIHNMGLDEFDDEHFVASRVYSICARFVKRAYAPNGEGGLFIINDRVLIRNVMRQDIDDMRLCPIDKQMNMFFRTQ